MIGESVSGDGHCKARNKAGGPCRAPAMRGMDYCLMHDPTESGVRRRKEMQTRGGATTTNRRKLLLGMIDFSSATSTRIFFETLARACLRGEVAPALARDTAAIAKEAVLVRQGEEAEARLSAVETALQALVERRPRQAGGEAV